MRLLPRLLALILVTSACLPVRADLIDFESGFTDGQQLGTVTTATNAVTFSTLAGNAFVVGVGGPEDAFVPDDMPSPALAGQFFLSDDHLSSGTGARSLAYDLDFQHAIDSLSIDIYDYGDGAGTTDHTITLTLFADTAKTIAVGSSTVMLGGTPAADGNVLNLSVAAPSAIAARIGYRFDPGTGIDNIEFVTAPAPASWVLGALGLLMTLGWRHIGAIRASLTAGLEADLAAIGRN